MLILTLTAQTGYYIYWGAGGLWITVQFKIRQTVHTSSHNTQYMFMPVLYAQDLTQLDGFKQYG